MLRLLILAIFVYACAERQTYKRTLPPRGETQPGDSETRDPAGADARAPETPAMPSLPEPPKPPAATPQSPAGMALTGAVRVTVNLTLPAQAGAYRRAGHIRSIWITDANDVYIKTIHASAGERALHLKRWFSFTANAPDGASGATLPNSANTFPLTLNWDLKDRNGALVAPGNYKLWLEFSEANTPRLDQGKKAAEFGQAIDNTAGYEAYIVPFTLAKQGASKMDSGNTVFQTINITHMP